MNKKYALTSGIAGPDAIPTQRAFRQLETALAALTTRLEELIARIENLEARVTALEP